MMGELLATGAPRQYLTAADRRDAEIMRYAIERAMDDGRQPELDQILATYPNFEGDETQSSALNKALLVAFGN